MRTRLILLAIIVLVFIYWRGIKKATTQKGMSCEYHIVYALCTAKNNKAAMPGIWDIFKAGMKF